MWKQLIRPRFLPERHMIRAAGNCRWDSWRTQSQIIREIEAQSTWAERRENAFYCRLSVVNWRPWKTLFYWARTNTREVKHKRSGNAHKLLNRKFFGFVINVSLAWRELYVTLGSSMKGCLTSATGKLKTEWDERARMWCCKKEKS